ncbi:MAG: FkbM family methyltransferase [Candidatus Acidiferrales bacterium]
MGSLLLRSPARLRSLRGVPVLGKLVHGLSHRLIAADEKIWARVESGPAKGIWIELNPRTGQNYLHGDGECAVQSVVAGRLRHGDVFYDLGANIGLFSLLGSRIVGDGGKVFSFEPDSATAGRLRRNISRNGFTNVSVIQAGVWSSSGILNFAAANSSSPDRGVGTFVNASDDAVSTPVPCIALDDFIKTAPPPNGIKCDVEGAEVEVFRGARGLLKKYRPWVLCEIHSEANGRALGSYLQEFAYVSETVDETHILAIPRYRLGD